MAARSTTARWRPPGSPSAPVRRGRGRHEHAAGPVPARVPDSAGPGGICSPPWRRLVTGRWRPGWGYARRPYPGRGIINRPCSAWTPWRCTRRSAPGDDDAVLIGHDWGAPAGYAATTSRRRLAPAGDHGGAAAGGPGHGLLLLRPAAGSWYMFFFQHPLAEMAVPMDDLAFVDRLWADWSPATTPRGPAPRQGRAARPGQPGRHRLLPGHARRVGLDPSPRWRPSTPPPPAPPPVCRPSTCTAATTAAWAATWPRPPARC